MARITRAAALAAVVFAALVPVRAAQSPSPPELALAMIRPDGILTPFAVFDGKTWMAAWPEPQDKMVLERMIEHVQSYWKQHRHAMPLAWHVVRPDQPALKVNVLEHIVFGEHCGNQVGLLTDMPSRREVDSMSHARMLAADRPLSVEMPIAFQEAAASAEWPEFLQAIHKEVARQEAAAIADAERHYGRRVSLPTPPGGATTRFRTLLVHTAPSGGRTMFYEALRSYGVTTGRPDDVSPLLVAAGWAHAEAGKPPSTRAERSVLISANYAGSPTRPMGVLTSHGLTFWLALVMGYESEGMSVVQLGAEGPREVLRTWIGGC